MNIDFYKPLGIALSRKKVHEQYLFKKFSCFEVLQYSDTWVVRYFSPNQYLASYFACQITSNEERLYLR